MVSIFTIAAICFSLVLSLVFPIVLAIVFLRRTHPGARPLLTGIGVFIVFALILEQILHAVFFNLIPGFAALAAGNPWVYATYGALAAGLFEETGRLLGFRFLRKDQREWRHAVAFGIGHGGIESIVIVALSLINLLFYVFLINTGAFDAVISAAPAAAAATLTQVRDSLLTESHWMYTLGGIERVCTIAFHIAMSILVCYAVAARKYSYYWLAVLLHVALDFPAALAQAGVLPIIAVELILVAIAVGAVFFILRSRKMFKSLGPDLSDVPVTGEQGD